MKFIRTITRSDADALQLLLVERLNLDLMQITADGVTAEYQGGTGPVVIRWQGVATMTVDEFEQILNPSTEGAPE